jgi:hypothetical protein
MESESVLQLDSDGQCQPEDDMLDHVTIYCTEQSHGEFQFHESQVHHWQNETMLQGTFAADKNDDAILMLWFVAQIPTSPLLCRQAIILLYVYTL